MRSSLIRFTCLLLLSALGSPAFAQKIVIISDINGSYGSTEYHSRVSAAVEEIIQLEPDLVISAGDMVAGQKQPLLDQQHLDQMWASFNRVVADPFNEAGIDFIVTPGNHDGSAYEEFEIEQKRYQAQWNERLPDLSLLDGSDWPHRYALWLGKVLIITIDGTRPGRLQETDLNLLRATLEREGPKAQSILVVSHLPMWPFAQGREKEIITDPALTALLARHQVDYFISGHHHVYYPGKDDNGVGHLGVGPLGGNARKIVGQSTREPFSFAVLEFCDSGYRISARKAPGFVEDVPLTSLPVSIKGQTGSLQRLDLSEEYPAEPTTPASTSEGLPADASVFDVTGEETDPIVITFSNGDKTVAFIPMIHVGTPAFYQAVAEKVKEWKEDGATLYYEFVDFDSLDEQNKRKARRLVGILPTPKMYEALSGSGYMGQNNDDFLGLVNDKDVNVDVTAEELIQAYEEEFGPIEVTGEDATSDLSEMTINILPGENVTMIIQGTRNQKVADAINNGPDADIVLLFGGAHGPGILADLQANDPGWRRVQ